MSNTEKTKEKLLEEVFGKEGREKFIPLIEEPKEQDSGQKTCY